MNAEKTTAGYLVIAIAIVMSACGEAPRKVEAVKVDPTSEAGYAEAVAELAAVVKDAKGLIAAGRGDEAGAAIIRGQPLSARVLAAPHPTLAAMEAASELDELYGRMLLGNKNYGWARMVFQKDRSRWVHWQPQSAETERRKKAAEAGMAECDRGMGGG
ncbi:MAG: hypothetical protein JWP63_6317 [Candidatus Solibacter sp.]|nr:hypothetical protein [Candidatus Solibacter sp.]